jgi:hypothetical protein
MELGTIHYCTVIMFCGLGKKEPVMLVGLVPPPPHPTVLFSLVLLGKAVEPNLSRGARGGHPAEKEECFGVTIPRIVVGLTDRQAVCLSERRRHGRKKRRCRCGGEKMGELYVRLSHPKEWQAVARNRGIWCRTNLIYDDSTYPTYLEAEIPNSLHLSMVLTARLVAGTTSPPCRCESEIDARHDKTQTVVLTSSACRREKLFSELLHVSASLRPPRMRCVL